MRTVLVLATLVTLASAGAIPSYHNLGKVKTQNVDAATVERQHKVLELFEVIHQVNIHSNYYKIGKDYDIKAHIGDYTKKEAVEKFFYFYEKEFMPKYSVFSVFNDKMREQAKALYDLFYYAKDFETFYKTAAWARVHVNAGMFAYSFYLGLVHRLDFHGLVVPPFYELVPEYFVNFDILQKMYYGKLRGEPFEEFNGVFKEGDSYFYYSNYSNYYTYGDEHKLAYLTEDIGWNSFYAHENALQPFWEESEYLINGILKERRGELYYHFYQQVLARYYLERLSNGLGEIPKFSWYQPFKYGYRPFLASKSLLFVQRSDDYVMQNEYNLDDLRFVRNYEEIFQSFLQQGQFNAYHKQVDFFNSKSINFVGNYWQANPDLYEKLPKPHYHRSYEMAARRILSGAPLKYKKQFELIPSALDFYQTSFRDPAFYQIYNKIMSFMLQYKQYLQPYSQESLHYVGVKVNNVEVGPLETFFDFHTFNATNGVYWSNEELLHSTKQLSVIQPRLNNQPFSVKINVKSDVDEEATFKVFIGPKFDSFGQTIKFEDNWMNFVELDWFTKHLTKGENVIERNSNDFFFYKDDSLSTAEIYRLLNEHKLPVDMVDRYAKIPKRLMLPRGTKDGFPLQIFVVVYKSTELPKEYGILKHYFIDVKPVGYPLDRPISDYFMQPNMFVKEVMVYHKGSEFPISYDAVEHSNDVTKH